VRSSILVSTISHSKRFGSGQITFGCMTSSRVVRPLASAIAWHHQPSSPGYQGSVSSLRRDRVGTLLLTYTKRKSIWVYYALCRRLVERAVIWYRDQTHYLFVKTGVFKAPPGFPSSYFRTFVWTLVDSDESQDGTPPRLLTPGTRLYVIYVASPRKEPWSRMGKTTREDDSGRYDHHESLEQEGN
jgi:hypothetical protein